MRGLIVAVLTFIVASILVGLPVDHVLVLIPSLFLVGFFFAQLGVLIGVRAEQFDDVAFAQTFILTPLIFLGGVFYSASLLPQPLETLTHFNPIYYMISLVRYGFVGFTEVSIPLSLLALTAGDRGALPGQPAPLPERLQAARLAPWARTAKPSAPVTGRLLCPLYNRSPMATRTRRRRRKPHKVRWHKFAIPIVLVVGCDRGRGRDRRVAWALNIYNSAPPLSSLKPVQKGRSSAIYAADGSLIGFIHSDNMRQPVSRGALPRDLKNATVAIEDKNFFNHGALDPAGIARAAWKDLLAGGKPVQGASTITQQLVRNLYIQQPRRDARTKDHGSRTSPKSRRKPTPRNGSSPPTSTRRPTGRSKGRPRSAPRRRRRPTSASRPRN